MPRHRVAIPPARLTRVGAVQGRLLGAHNELDLRRHRRAGVAALLRVEVAALNDVLVRLNGADFDKVFERSLRAGAVALLRGRKDGLLERGELGLGRLDVGGAVCARDEQLRKP